MRVDVAVPGRTYPVLIGEPALDSLPDLLGAVSGRVAVIADAATAQIWRDVEMGLRTQGRDVSSLAIEGGEKAKTMASLEAVLDFLDRSRIGRDGCLVAVGGGTVGDLAGFAAAVWQRGVPHFQVPTTLLAMVDSSIGGKTGVNSARAKNSIGSFWQPAGVVIDPRTLATLDSDEFRGAFGEVVKYAVAMDADLAGMLAEGGARLLDRDPATLEDVVARCVRLKAEVVAVDERDTDGRRAVLNYGHTVGHAIEAALGFDHNHGRAVAHGMRAAAMIAAELGLCPPELPDRQEHLLARFDLPGPLPRIDPERVLEALPRDKKSSGGRPRWVLPVAIGRAESGHDAPDHIVSRVVAEILDRAAA